MLLAYQLAGLCALEAHMRTSAPARNPPQPAGGAVTAALEPAWGAAQGYPERLGSSRDDAARGERDRARRPQDVEQDEFALMRGHPA